MESPETNLHVYGQFIYFRGGAAERVVRTYFQLMVLGQLDIYVRRRKKKLEPLPHITPHINMHSRLIVDKCERCNETSRN